MTLSTSATTTSVVLASGNVGKLLELNVLLADAGLTLIRQTDLGVAEVAETGLSFVENALIKARNAAKITNLPAIADDSGLSVTALAGEPGIYSARYAGELSDDAANNARLLEALKHVPIGQRQAVFCCCIVYLRHAHDPMPLIAQAQWQGEVLLAPSGAGGFGYDPLFYVPSHQCSAAELEPVEKNRISHRGQALQLLLKQLAA